MNPNDLFDNLWKQNKNYQTHADPRFNLEQQNTKLPSFTGKCLDCNVEIEKPYIRCDDCQDKYIRGVTNNDKKE